MKLKTISYFVIICFAVFVQQSTSATLFSPISIEDQLRESYGVVEGYYLRKIYKILPSTGQVVTEISFKVEKSSGLRKNEMLNKNEMKILIPGGIWQGITYKVHGTPVFDPSERIILLLNKTSDGLWLHSLALGLYKIDKIDGEYYLISSVFPDHPRVGKLSYDDFKKLISKVWHKKFSKNKVNELIVTRHSKNIKDNNEDLDRRPASLDNDSDNDSDTAPWIIFIFTILGIASNMIAEKGSSGD